MSDKPAITLSSRDFDRLDALLRNAPQTAVHEGLRTELERAKVVEPGELPKGVVSMNSVVRLADVDDLGRPQTPQDGDQRQAGLEFGVAPVR